MGRNTTDALVLLLPLLAAVAPGCYGDQLLVASFAAPESSCDVLSAPSAPPLTRGLLDVAFAEDYSATLVLLNRVDNGRADGPESVRVEGLNVQIWQGGRPEGDAFYSFYQPAPGYVSESSEVALPAVVFPAQAVLALLAYRFPDYSSVRDVPFEEIAGYRDLVTLGVRVLGTTTSGRQVESQEAYLPVEICFGCLVDCPPESADPDTGSYCESLAAPERTPCRLGQDEVFDCRLCVPTFDASTCSELCAL